MTQLTNLLDKDPAQLVAYCAELGEKPFRAKQLLRWIHQFGASDFDAMTDLAKSLRDKLATRFGKRVKLQTQVAPELLGGLVVRVGDELMDGSVKTRLNRMRERLIHSKAE